MVCLIISSLPQYPTKPKTFTIYSVVLHIRAVVEDIGIESVGWSEHLLRNHFSRISFGYYIFTLCLWSSSSFSNKNNTWSVHFQWICYTDEFNYFFCSSLHREIILVSIFSDLSVFLLLSHLTFITKDLLKI